MKKLAIVLGIVGVVLMVVSVVVFMMHGPYFIPLLFALFCVSIAVSFFFNMPKKEEE